MAQHASCFEAKLESSEIAQAVEAHGYGRSLATLADQFHVSPETVRQAAVRRGIPIRPRRISQ